MVKLLIEFKADLNLSASVEADLEALRATQSPGSADRDIKLFKFTREKSSIIPLNKKYLTPLEIALLSGHQYIVEYLEKIQINYPVSKKS